MGAKYFLGIMKNIMTPTMIITLLLRIRIREEIIIGVTYRGSQVLFGYYEKYYDTYNDNNIIVTYYNTRRN